MKDKKFEPMWIGLFAIILLAGILFVTEFLNSKDCAECITGKEALATVGGSFWLWAIVGTIASAIIIFFIAKKVKAQGGWGIKLNVLLPPLILLMIVWGKGCDVKADPVSGANHKVSPKPIDNREAAEDMLKK